MNQPTHAHNGLGADNTANLEVALESLARLVRARIAGEDLAPGGTISLNFYDDGSELGNLIRDRQPSFAEYIVLLLALTPHANPTLLDCEIRAALAKQGDFPEIGGIRHAEARIFLPTGQTAAYLLASDDLNGRFEVQRLFRPEHWFARSNLLRLVPAKDGAPALSGQLVMSREWADRLTLGLVDAPPFSVAFPARRITTDLNWDDLVLPESTRERLDELLRWTRYHQSLSEDWGFGARLRPGYRALFHGPSGTGKTFAATLLGRSTRLPVYRVDLSVVVSKYVGETEKNLSNLFEAAHRRNWILFFDEADALFGKRTAVKDSHDRYANQEVSYLLQRVEEYDGLCILASNLRANIDDAFLRRFNAIIRFPEPGPEERMAIWDRALPNCGPPTERDALIGALKEYELTGGGIVNVAQFAAIEAAARGERQLSLADVELGIRREVEKEGRVFREPSQGT
jgi:AAA+ superfamily predicted ATPase